MSKHHIHHAINHNLTTFYHVKSSLNPPNPHKISLFTMPD
jgi:hypothetical protein